MANVGGGSGAPVVTPVGGGIEKQVTTNVPKDVKAVEVAKQAKDLKTKEDAAVKSGDVKSHEACRSPLQALVKSLGKLIAECDEKKHRKYLESLEAALGDAQQQIKDLDATIKDLKKHIEEEQKRGKDEEPSEEDEDDAAVQGGSPLDPKKCGSLLKKIAKLPPDKAGLPFACGVKPDKTAVFVLDIPGVTPAKLRDALKEAGCKVIACGNAKGTDGELVLDVVNGKVPSMSKLVSGYLKNTVKSPMFPKVRAARPEDDAAEEETPTGRQAPKPADEKGKGDAPAEDAGKKPGAPTGDDKPVVGDTPAGGDKPADAPAPAATTLKISADVGEGAANRKPDVLAVQQALNRANGNQALKEDGVCGSATKTAIRTYQEKVVGYKRGDGRVDPGGATESWLNGNKVPLPKPKPAAKQAKSGGGAAKPAKPAKPGKPKGGGGEGPVADPAMPGPDPEHIAYIESLTRTYENNLQAAQSERDSLIGEFENSDKGWTSLPAEARDFIARIDSELAAARKALAAFSRNARSVAEEPMSRTLESFKQQIAGDNKQTLDAIEKPMFTITQARNWLKSQ